MAFRIKDLMISDFTAAEEQGKSKTPCTLPPCLSMHKTNPTDPPCHFPITVTLHTCPPCICPGLSLPTGTIFCPTFSWFGGSPFCLPYTGIGSENVVSPESSTLEQLALLKAQLKAAIEQVEKEEEALENRGAPKTVAETEALQRKLREAADELENLKAELKKKS